MQKVVFIAGLGHSGSTLLDLVLGSHSQVVGLGEINALLKPDSGWIDRIDESVCSCGHTADKCVLWKEPYPELRLKRQASRETKNRIVLDVFQEVLGQDCILVDSSKKTQPLHHWLQVEGVDLNVIHLIKDVRAFTISAIDVTKRKRSQQAKGRNIGDWLPDSVKLQPIRVFWHWYRKNREMQEFIASRNLARYQVGYEEICLYSTEIVLELCQFLGIEYESSMQDPSRSHSHALLGNRMRNQSQKRKAVLYDNRWFHRNEWVLPYALFRNIASYNAAEVYRNTKEKTRTR